MLTHVLLQINQINKTYWECTKKKMKKKHDLWKIIFFFTQSAIMRRSVITLGLIFTTIVLNQAQGSKKKKSKKFQCEKMSTSGDITKNVGPGSLGLKYTFDDELV